MGGGGGSKVLEGRLAFSDGSGPPIGHLARGLITSGNQVTQLLQGGVHRMCAGTEKQKRVREEPLTYWQGEHRLQILLSPHFLHFPLRAGFLESLVSGRDAALKPGRQVPCPQPSGCQQR